MYVAATSYVGQVRDLPVFEASFALEDLAFALPHLLLAVAASCASAAPAAPLAVRYHDVLVVPLLVADLLVAFAEHRRESNFSFFERATEASCNSLSALGNRRARRRSSLRIWQKVFSRFCLLAAPASGPGAGRGQKSAAGASQEKRERGLPGKGADTGREEKELIPAYQGLIPGYQGLIPRKSP